VTCIGSFNTKQLTYSQGGCFDFSRRFLCLNIVAHAGAHDVLIIEDYPAFDPQLKAMGVHTTNISTKLQQAAKRQGQLS